jgi:hypothetical protein
LAPVAVQVVSSDTKVGTIGNSPLLFGGGDGTKTAEFRPSGAGSAIVSITAPAGFATPSTTRQILATVTVPGITLTLKPVGKDLQAPMTFHLAAPAPAGGAAVTITSADPSRVLLANSARLAGAESTTVNLTPGSSDGTFYVQGLAASGVSQLTATAANFNRAVGDVILNPSGFAFNSARDFSIGIANGNYSLFVGAFALDSQTLNPREEMELRSGAAEVSVDVVSSTRSVGTLTVSQLIFNSGDREKNTQFRPLAPGSTSLTVSVPAGFVAPTSGTVVKATVNQ